MTQTRIREFAKTSARFLLVTAACLASARALRPCCPIVRPRPQDHQVGRVMSELESLGKADTTIVLLHGEKRMRSAKVLAQSFGK